VSASAQTTRANRQTIPGSELPSNSGGDHCEEQQMNRIFLTALMMLTMLGPLTALSGCNTVAGAGEDIERGGQKVEGAARDVQRKL
jgi:entericidin B